MPSVPKAGGNNFIQCTNESGSEQHCILLTFYKIFVVCDRMKAVNGQKIGKLAGKLLNIKAPTQAQTNHFARTAGMFTKHVVGTTVKPIHSLWHEVIGFVFMVFAGLGAWKLFSGTNKLEPPQFFLSLIFIVVLAAYGLSSVRKSRKIKRG